MPSNTMVSLFSGAGLMDLGFELAGWECVAAVEIDKNAVATWKHNRPGREDRILCEDIRKVDAERLGVTPGTLGLIIGGPPCQGFSTANGQRVHRNGNTSAWKDDPRNLLYKEYLRLVKALRPERFVMENVKAMFTTGAEDTGQPGPIMREVLTDFTEAGYRVQAQVLDAADYGVPQFRERVIVIGVRADLPDSIRYPIRSHGAPGSGFTPWRTVRDAIGDLPDPVSNIWRDTGERRVEEWVDPDKPAKLVRAEERPGRAFRMPPNHTGADGLDLGAVTNPQGDGTPAYLQTDAADTCWWPYKSLDEPSGTLRSCVPGCGFLLGHGEMPTEHMHTNGQGRRYLLQREGGQIKAIALPTNHELLPSGETVYEGYESTNRPLNPDEPRPTLRGNTRTGQPLLQQAQPRRLTPRECARLQSVPDDYFFCGSKSATYRQIGNGVPVELARRIAAVLIGTEKGREVKPYQPQLTLF